MKQIKKQQREANSMEGTKLYKLLIQCTEFRIAFEKWVEGLVTKLYSSLIL